MPLYFQNKVALLSVCSDVVGVFGWVGVGRENGWTRLFTLRIAEP